MGIFSRFGDIINANLTALLDRAEDPAKMIRMMIQEMEETLVEVRTTSARVIADRKEQERRVTRLQQEASDWEAKARLAISKGREDLARAALAEQQAVEDSLKACSRELTIIEEQLQVLHEEIGQLQQKLDDAKTKQKALLVREQTSRSRMDMRRSGNREKLEEAFRKFDAYERKMDNLEAQLESEDLGRGRSLHDEFAELERNDKVEEALAALKARMSGDSRSDS
ncbi:phage shock protein PspA [Pokkaliibacter plantistimulans]|uniref:Phage shock protein PspA n=1 Tax=Proteobacteria bacterium 228 TaxID=2083153 RepID=A0A2S5KUM0_9PROT|nr:phage shock protein PspA [Pokkaliibacter plantistimulans]PPC78352.1 phage shock protein PspA [Pokkaliibacter plantistimulans]